MEGIGAAASIVSLLQILGNIHNIIQFLFRYNDSTSDFRRLSEQIENLTARSELFKIVERWANACDSLLEETESAILKSSLLAAQKNIFYVRDVNLKYGKGKTSVAKRFKWAIRDGHAWNELASRLQEAQSALALTMQIIAMSVCPVVPEVPWQLTPGRKISTLDRDGVRSELREIRAILDQEFTRSSETNSVENASSDDLLDPPEPENRVSTRTLWLLPDRWFKYGVQLALTSVEKTYFTSNALAIKMPIPIVVMGSTFMVDLTVRNYVLGLPDMSSLSCRLAIRNLIPESSEIVKACESQDLATVKDLLLRHRHGPNDMTKDFRPLLWVRLC